MPVGMPLVRYFMGELDANGEKLFKEVPPADLARMDPNNDGAPPLTYGDFATAFDAIAGSMPDNGVGGLVGGLAAMMSGGLKEVHNGVTAMEESPDGFGGDGASDGIGMALGKELLDNFNAGTDGLAIPTYVVTISPRRLTAMGPSLTSCFTRPTTAKTLGSPSCISQSCGATDESIKNLQTILRMNSDLAAAEGRLFGYVIRLNTTNEPRDFVWERKTYRLHYAALWLMSVNGQLAILGGNEELVPARRRFEYARYDQEFDLSSEKIVIDTYSEGFESTNTLPFQTMGEALLAPGMITQFMQRGNTDMKVKRFLTRLTKNAGPPTQAEIAALISDTMATSLDDPTSSIPPSSTTPPTPALPPGVNPGSGVPFLNPGQGIPNIRN